MLHFVVEDFQLAVENLRKRMEESDSQNCEAHWDEE